jgi:hypothetical protein
MKPSLEKRLEALERQHEPQEFVLVWYDSDSKPPAPGAIQLKWLEDL